MIDFDACPCSGKTLGKLVKPAVLMLLARHEMHGYEILHELTRLPLFEGLRPDNTGVYRALRSMADTGLVTSAWAFSETGPARRVYRLTSEGRACLERWMDTLERYRNAVEQLLDMGRTAVGRAPCCQAGAASCPGS